MKKKQKSDGEPQAYFTCRDCLKELSYTPIPGHPDLIPGFCTPCTIKYEQGELARQESVNAERRAAALQERQDQWVNVICPPLYQQTDRSKVPETLRKAVRGWQYGPKGLGLVGVSRTHKTRAMFLLLERLYVRELRSCIYVTSAQFSNQISRLAGDGMEKLESYLKKLCKADVLFVDDLGKGSMTDRVEGEFFHVVETRISNLLPILFTANADGDALAGTMSRDRGVPIAARLGEFCEIVKI